MQEQGEEQSSSSRNKWINHDADKRQSEKSELAFVIAVGIAIVVTVIVSASAFAPNTIAVSIHNPVG